MIRRLLLMLVGYYLVRSLLNTWRSKPSAEASALPMVRSTSPSTRSSSSLEASAKKQPNRKKKVLWEVGKLMAVLLVLAVGGFLVAASGIVPVKASSGHWAITEWFLSFSMRRSVSTHSLGIEVPPLDDPLQVLKGAGHFELGCSFCHGSPIWERPLITAELTPEPPNLSVMAPEWDAEELFYIVKHGVKMTGMPAWPARERDDEVWAVTAFLQKLPDLEPAEYRELVYGKSTEQQATTGSSSYRQTMPSLAMETCARCHGADGLGRGLGAFPALAGQNQAYLEATLQAYAQGNRHSGIMQTIATDFSAEEISQLAKHYASLEFQNPLAATDTSEAIGRGKTIATEGLPDKKVPACISCHGPVESPRNPHYPLLAGQYYDYLVLQLELFHNNTRGGTEYAHLMRDLAKKLTKEEMRNVALYYSSLLRD